MASAGYFGPQAHFCDHRSDSGLAPARGASAVASAGAPLGLITGAACAAHTLAWICRSARLGGQSRMSSNLLAVRFFRRIPAPRRAQCSKKSNAKIFFTFVSKGKFSNSILRFLSFMYLKIVKFKLLMNKIDYITIIKINKINM
jgi:hypothetical protein